MAPGEDQYELVRAYAALGDHRTGTAVDHETARWFAAALVERGCPARVVDEPYEHWRADTYLIADGDAVAHLALPYEFDGRIDTDRVYVAELDVHWGGHRAVLEPAIDAARAAGAHALAVATKHTYGSLVGVNTSVHAGNGMPVLLVAGRDFELVRDGSARVYGHAGRRPGRLPTVVGRSGDTGAPLMLTTPLSGWFRAAGERGTGIAVLLGLVGALAARGPLAVVGTSGHELDFLGARRYAASLAEPPRAIVHLGASIAVDTATRHARTNLASLGRAAEHLAAARLQPAAGASDWIGEATVWQALGVPLLSISGAGVDFHTPDDLPERATSPAALAATTDAIRLTIEEHFS